MTIIGAIARIGIVCEATMYGSTPRWSTREWWSTTPIVNPIAAPRRNPTAASFAVKSAASQSTSIRSGPFVRDGSKSWPTISCRCGIVRSVTVNVPSRSSVVSPSHLKPSQRPQSTASTASSFPAWRSTGLSSQSLPLTPSRTVEELRELRELTGNEDGAQRVAWTDTWAQAKEWLSGKLAGTGVEEETDEAGNQWFTLRGASDRALLIGGHIDSVPNGGWLDGCLNVVAGVEVLRRLAEDGEPPLTVRLVELGGRGGRALRPLALRLERRGRLDERPGRAAAAQGRATASRSPTRSRAHGVDLDRALDARRQLENAAAYLELHIEQGPVLESMDLPLGVVLGTFGVERHQITWRGQAAHAGSTPMDKRRDALAGAAKLALEIRPIAAQVGRRRGLHVGRRRDEARDRHLRRRDGRAAARPAAPRRGLARGAARGSRRRRPSGSPQEEDIEVEWERIWSIEPILFDAELIELADESIREVAGTSHRLPSGPLHDAAEVARAGIPTVMLFVQSLRGLSHTKLEDTKPEHLELAVEALDRLAQKTLERGAVRTSVIVRAYRAWDTLPAALEALRPQVDRPDRELVLVESCW